MLCKGQKSTEVTRLNRTLQGLEIGKYVQNKEEGVHWSEI